jgi:hypothetical protein
LPAIRRLPIALFHPAPIRVFGAPDGLPMGRTRAMPTRDKYRNRTCPGRCFTTMAIGGWQR